MKNPKQILAAARRLIHDLRTVSDIGITCPSCHSTTAGAKAPLFTADYNREIMTSAEQTFRACIQEIRDELHDVRKEKPERIRRTTLSTNIGQIIEHFAPILPGFPYHPNDCRALFKPIDYLVFDGFHKNAIERIQFIEVKSSNATWKSNNEKVVKRLVEAGRVRLVRLPNATKERSSK